MSSLRNPYNRQLDRIRRREDRLFRESGGGSALKTGLREKIESKIPEKLMETMDAAFYTAFQVISSGGLGCWVRPFRKKGCGQTGTSRSIIWERTRTPGACAPSTRARS